MGSVDCDIVWGYVPIDNPARFKEGLVAYFFFLFLFFLRIGGLGL